MVSYWVQIENNIVENYYDNDVLIVIFHLTLYALPTYHKIEMAEDKLPI